MSGKELWGTINPPNTTHASKPTNPTPKEIPLADTIPSDMEERIGKSKMRGLMWPTGPACKHPAFPLLQEYALRGCPVDCGRPWTEEQIRASLERGPHQSSNEPDAAAALWTEATDKSKQGFADIIAWKSIKDNIPEELKLSPIAMIPHNSRKFRAILDLSFVLRLFGIEVTSVNDATNKEKSPTNAMGQLGQVLPRLIAKMAEATLEDGPLMFAKLDIKDGYWRMVVAEGKEWNFAYVLPKRKTDTDFHIVVPSALQMGWAESPPFFCAASETARDVAEVLATAPLGTAIPHPLEEYMLPPAKWPESYTETHGPKYMRVFEDYVDDFIAMAQTTNQLELQHLSRSLLHAVHSVFPPPAVTNHSGEESISMKKLLQGDGLWEHRKEILGWLFDGATRCIELPSDKQDRIQVELKAILRLKTVPRKRLEKIVGKLRHAAIGIPAGRGLFGPVNIAMAQKAEWFTLTKGSPLRLALNDWRYLIRVANIEPTHCKELIPGDPEYIGYCDAAKRGMGGVWLSGTKELEPFVWDVPFPEDIRKRFVSWSNPTGDITNSDLEMAAHLMQWLALELTHNVRHAHAAIASDNTATVAWARRLDSKRSHVAKRLLRVLAVRQRVCRASPLLTISIAGKDNDMADAASRWFRNNDNYEDIPDDLFLPRFNAAFPLPQNASWKRFHFSSKMVTKVISELVGPPSSMASWMRITKRGGSFGKIGAITSPLSTSAPTLTNQAPTTSSYSWDSLKGSGQVTSVEERLSEFSRLRSRFAPLARPANWLENPTPSTAQNKNTSCQLNDKSNVTDEKTHPPSPN
jgi:hypothetical protein